MWENFEEAAAKLGLSFTTTTGLISVARVHGELEGQKVRSTWGDRASTVEALLDPQLDLGLSIQSTRFVPRVSLSQKVWLNDSNWDMEVDAFADEGPRAALLFAADARRAVLGLNATSTDFTVTDDRVTTFLLQADPDLLVHAFQLVARTAALISTARLAVPAATPLTEQATALRACARQLGLSSSETPLAARGTVRSVRLEARFVRTGRGEYDLVVGAAPIDASLGAGLLVKRETALDRVRTFLGGQDLQTGDAAFDPAFLVQAREGERAIAALDDDVRGLLLELRRRFEVVTLDDGGLVLRGPAARVPANETANLLETACAVVERAVRASAAVAQGPYR